MNFYYLSSPGLHFLWSGADQTAALIVGSGTSIPASLRSVIVDYLFFPSRSRVPGVFSG